MEGKDFLQQYQQVLTDIRNLEAEAKEVENLAMSSTLCIDRERVQSFGRQDRMAELATKVVDIEHQILVERMQALDTLKSVREVIQEIENKNYRRLLYQKYIEDHTWDQIAEKMSDSVKHIYKKHGRALQEVNNYLEKETKCE